MEVISMSSMIFDIVSKIISSNTKISKNDSIEELNEKVNRQDISLQLAQQQARIAQELAIALRIETADEVEIEEFYDNSGEGNAGLKASQEGISLGISGGGRRITKRIYKFKGLNGEKLEIYEQKLNEVLLSNVKQNDENIKDS